MPATNATASHPGIDGRLDRGAGAMLEVLVAELGKCTCGGCFELIHPAHHVRMQAGREAFAYPPGNDKRVRQRDLTVAAPAGCKVDNRALMLAAKQFLAASGIEHQAGESLLLLSKLPGTHAQLWHVDQHLDAVATIKNVIVPITDWQRADTLRGGTLEEATLVYRGGSKDAGGADPQRPGEPYTFRGDKVHRGAANPTDADRYALFLTDAADLPDGTQGVTFFDRVPTGARGQKYRDPGGYVLVDHPRRLSRLKLDAMASRAHPLGRVPDSANGLCGGNLRRSPCPAALRPGPMRKKFRGVDQVSGWYQQIVVSKFDMRGSAPQREGQCVVPAITFAAGTVAVTHVEWRDLADSVSFEGLRRQVYRQGYLLDNHFFRSPAEFFATSTAGMWVMTCVFRGEPHWLGYSAWNATLYEPAMDRLLVLEQGDFAEGRIDEALAKIGIETLVCYGQLWSAAATAGSKGRRRGGGGGAKRPRP